MSEQPPYDPEIVSQPCAKAPLNPRWTLKLGVIALIVFAVGCWGLWDAAVFYPARGKKYAEWAKLQYLQQAKTAESEEFGIFLTKTSVTDPVQEYAFLSEPDRLNKMRQSAGNPNSPSNKRDSMKLAKREWLNALHVVGMLDPVNTVIESPQSTLDALDAEWSKNPNNPEPLSNFDLTTQWLIMGVCYFIALWMLVHMLRVRGQKYAWDPDTMTLTLPSGAGVTPDDLEEVDKRKWDKFIVFLRIKDSHPKLGGQEVRIDTYQHARVEDWVLAMEEKAFPSQQQPDTLNEEPSDADDEATNDSDAE